MKTKRNNYRIRNWHEYNAGLKQRGSLSFWLDEAVIDTWLSHDKTGKRGASRTYSDLATQTVATMKSIYALAGRQAEGLVESLFELMGVALPVPEHSTVSRRLANLELDLPVRAKAGPRHVVIDATGIKIYGEGEWKTRQRSTGTRPARMGLHYGISKRRTWRKLHVAVDEHTGESWDRAAPGR